MLKKQPRTVAQITSNLTKIVDELDHSEAEFQKRAQENAEKRARLDAEDRDIADEMDRNKTVSGKLKDLLGY